MTRKSVLALLVSFSIVFAGCFNTSEDTQNTDDQTHAEAEILPSVEIQEIGQKISEYKISKLGKVTSEQKSTVTAEVSGRLVSLNANLGQEVKAGEIIASLGNSLNTELIAINSSLASKDAALSQAILGSTIASSQKEIEVMQKNVDNALINYQSSLSLEADTQKLVKEQLEQAEIGLNQAKTGYKNNLTVFAKTKDASYTTQDNSYESLLKQTQAAVTHLELALDTGDLLFAQKNSKYNVLRGEIKRKNDYSSYVKTEHNFIKSWDEIEYIKAAIKEAEIDYNNTAKIEYAANSILTLIDKVEGVLVQGDNYLQDITVSPTLGLEEPISKFNAKFPQDVASLSNDRSSLQNTINSLKSSYKNNQVQLTTLGGQVKQGAIQIDSAYNSLKQTQINAQSQLNKLSFQVETAKNQYESSQAQLNSLIAKLKAQELQAQNGVNQAAKQALTSNAQLNATQIKAPIDGSITSITIQEGDIANQGQALLTIESTDSLKIETSVSEQDLENITLGTTVDITNSKALTSTGFVSKISKAQKSAELFPIEITLTENNQLRSGTFVRLEFNSEEVSEEGFFIPLKSVFFSKNNRTVYVVNGEGKIEQREVNLRKILNQKVEVISGLQESDKVIIEGGRQLNPGDKVLTS